MTARELNRALLARQGLLDPHPGTVPQVLERIGGIQAQYAPSMYVGLWSRMRALSRDGLTRLLEERAVVQGTLLRATIHLVSAEDYWPMALAVREERRRWQLRAGRGVPEEEYAAAAERVRRALVDGPVRRATLDQVARPVRVTEAGLWLDLVRVPPSGTWERRRADLFATAESWLGAPGADDGERGPELLVRRYLTAFGPATPAAVGDWAGLPVRALGPVLARLPLRRFLAEDGVELIDLPGLPLPDGDVPAPVRFLPTWDAALLVHARRAGALPERLRPLVFSTRSPQSIGTFLVDGAVAGSWKPAGARVELHEFEPLGPQSRAEVSAEAERLAAFLA
ncbi:winged helix DNA-binding domain-containing protein [Motilibacter sp. K478]|nr:winged helix DNA-binding domain-containing protein [Motilibacter aurantiacus]